MSNVDTIVDVDGEVVERDKAWEEFKIFSMNMATAAYEEAILRFGIPKGEAKRLFITTQLAKDYKFKAYQPKAEDLVTEPTEEPTETEISTPVCSL